MRPVILFIDDLQRMRRPGSGGWHIMQSGITRNHKCIIINVRIGGGRGGRDGECSTNR